MRRLFLTLIFLCLALPAAAVSLISDEEAESWLYDLLTPIFRAANLPLNRDYVHIVKDDSLNAFVGDQNHMFVHTGTLLKAKNSNEIEGVLAHETGHILGGHILRLKIKMQDLQKATLASLIAAAGAAVRPRERPCERRDCRRARHPEFRHQRHDRLSGQRGARRRRNRGFPPAPKP